MGFEAALSYIQKHGNQIDKYRANYLLKEERNDQIPLKHFGLIQNKDGGFPYNLEKGKRSNMSQTCSTLNILKELNLQDSNICKKAIQFLFKTQQKNGSWDENPKTIEYNPPPWGTPGKLETKTWITAEVASNLIKLGYKNSEQVRKAARFLKNNQDEKGKITGYRIATWIALSVFAQLEGIENKMVQKSLKLVEEWLKEEETDASFLNWYIICLHDAKISHTHPLFQECLKRLAKTQRENGSWTSVDGKVHIIPTTITALKLLKDFEVWKPRK